jgi:uncharacterized protein (TIGR00255 family)
MQQSMTGFGNDERKAQHLTIRSELKCLNSKFLDFSCRIPKELASKETELRNLVNTKIKRGKAMLTIELEQEAISQVSLVDTNLFQGYYNAFKELAKSDQVTTDSLFQLAIQSPDVLQTPEIGQEGLPWTDILESVNATLEQCIDFRKKEGLSLTRMLESYIHSISDQLDSVKKIDKQRIQSIKERLQSHLSELRSDIQLDENRFEQEIIYYIEKLDISEEIVRLGTHLDYFIEVLKSEANAGKKLGFISQEIGREINTIGSKANDSGIQRCVVVMKDDLEKIKEQLLNIL